jgi:hypothetical protein
VQQPLFPTLEQRGLTLPLAFRTLPTLLMVVAFPAFGQVHQSSETLWFTLSDEIVAPPPASLHQMTQFYLDRLKYFNDLAEDEGGYGPPRRALREWVAAPLDYISDNVEGLEGAIDFVYWMESKIYEGNAQVYRARRDFHIQLTIDDTARKIVGACEGDSACAAAYYAALTGDPLIREQLAKLMPLARMTRLEPALYLTLP